MKKTVLLLFIVLFSVMSCEQKPLSFLCSMGVGVDSLMMDTVPQPAWMSGYQLTAEQYDQLFGEKQPWGTIRKHARITGIKAVKDKYLISFASYAYYEFLALFNSQGELLDGVFCGVWGAGEPHKTIKYGRYEENSGSWGEWRSDCKFCADTSFIIHAVRRYNNKAMIYDYSYKIVGDKIVFLNKAYEEKPDSMSFFMISCGPISEEEECLWADLIRRPISDTTVITAWNQVLMQHNPKWSQTSIVSGLTASFYWQHPQKMLAWIDLHRNDSTALIETSLMAQCSVNKYLQEHLQQQIDRK